MHNKSETLGKISKTQLKKEAMALRELGKKLTSFPTNDLDQLRLNPKLRAAIDDFKRLPNSYGAKKRQLQYIGKLIREYGGKVLQAQIHHLNSSSKQQTKLNSSSEISERIISEGEVAITEIVAAKQQFDRQKLRQLRSNILKANPKKRDSAENKLQAYIKLIVD